MLLSYFYLIMFVFYYKVANVMQQDNKQLPSNKRIIFQFV